MREGLQTTLDDEFRDDVVLRQRQGAEIVRRDALLSDGLWCLRRDGLRVPDGHLRETLVHRSKIAGTVLENAKEKVEEVSARLCVLAQVAENPPEQVLFEDVRIEQETNECSQGGLVEELYRLPRLSRLGSLRWLRMSGPCFLRGRYDNMTRPRRPTVLAMDVRFCDHVRRKALDEYVVGIH